MPRYPQSWSLQRWGWGIHCCVDILKLFVVYLPAIHFNASKDGDWVIFEIPYVLVFGDFEVDLGDDIGDDVVN